MKTSCVYVCLFRESENKEVNNEDVDRVKCKLCKNTVVISRMNTPEHIGACGYVNKDYENLFLPDRLWLVSFSSSFDAKFSWRWLSSHILRQQNRYSCNRH